MVWFSDWAADRTAAFAVEAVAARIAKGLRAAQYQAQRRRCALARQFGVPLTSFAKHRRIDVTIDGADQVERGTLNLIKGLGGALLREKIVARASDRMIVVIDKRKKCSFQFELLIGTWRSSLRPGGRSNHPGASIFSGIPGERACDLLWCRHRKGGWHAQAAEFPSIHRIGARRLRRLPWGRPRHPGSDRPAAQRTAPQSIPDFTRSWTHPAFPWFEPPASGPGPVTNRSRWPQQPGGDIGTVPFPASSGRGRRERLRPTGRRLHQSDLAALGSGGGEKVRRNVDCGHHLREPFQPMLADADAVHLQGSHWCRSFSSRTWS